MTRLAPALARRIDRLARHAHAFHRFAHHPLCANYRGELISLGGRRRFCRGCALLVLGLGAGVGLGALLPVNLSAGIGALGLAVVLLALSLRVRLSKLVSRFAPGLLSGFALLVALRFDGFTRVGALLGVPVALFVAREVYRRRGPNRAPCTQCPELERRPRCSGFAPIVLRERAFQRLAQRWIDAARPSGSAEVIRRHA